MTAVVSRLLDPVVAPSAVVPNEVLTADDFYALRGSDRTELSAGKVLKKMPVSFEHGEVAGNIFAAFMSFLRDHKVGRVTVEGGFRLSRNPDTVRAPDVAFVSLEALEGKTTHTYVDGPPTLAVEIVSPNDVWSEIETKVRLYFAAGCRLVWIVDPQERTLTARTPEGTSHTYNAEAEVSAAPVLPGFVLPLTEIWP